MSLECPICLDLIETNDYQTDCKHVFHRHCIIEWSDKKREFTCPLCRKMNRRNNEISIHEIKIGKKYKVQGLHLNYNTNQMYIYKDYNFIAEEKGVSLGNVPYVRSGHDYFYDNSNKFFEIFN